MSVLQSFAALPALCIPENTLKDMEEWVQEEVVRVSRHPQEGFVAYHDVLEALCARAQGLERDPPSEGVTYVMHGASMRGMLRVLTFISMPVVHRTLAA